MPYTDSNIPKAIFHLALVRKFLRIARSSLLDKDFNEKAMWLLKTQWKHKGHNPFGVEKHYPKSFEDEKAFANFG